MSGPGAKTVALKIDGRELSAPEGAFVLGIAREAGIEIPTLCDDPAVEPMGACRLCLVEVTHPDWKGWSGLMTACLYPAAEGIEVSTSSAKVLEARRQVLALLAARCPGSEVIRKLAADHGVTQDELAQWGYLVDPDADDCILCGLCTRVCETYATSAIATVNRGATKAIGSFGGEDPAECVGCGACALVCPTGNITARRSETDYRIWDRAFDTAVCTVERTRCMGCGSCEEACPFNVARVAFQADGRRVATIPREHCRGCGACVGACPSGAIDQERHEGALLFGGLSDARIAVASCARSDLERSALPAGVRLTELPCTGRIGSALLLAALERGAEGVLVLGRHQQSCRLDGAEDPVRECVRRAREALSMAGAAAGRLRFVVPEPGPRGPLDAVTQFVSSIAPLGNLTRNGESTPIDGSQLDEGLDTSLAMLARLSARKALRPDGSIWLALNDLPSASAGQAMLFTGILPYVSILGEKLLAPLSVPDLLAAALATLSHLGVEDVGIRVGGAGITAGHHAALFAGAKAVYTLSAEDAAGLAAVGVEAVALDQLLLERAARLPRLAIGERIACDGSPAEVSMIEALGHVPVDVGQDPLPSTFRISPVQRVEAEERLERAEAAGARALLASDPMTLARWALITRRGTWRSSRVLPLMAHQLAFSGTESHDFLRSSHDRLAGHAKTEESRATPYPTSGDAR